jgi:hypothetical protein
MWDKIEVVTRLCPGRRKWKESFMVPVCLGGKKANGVHGIEPRKSRKFKCRRQPYIKGKKQMVPAESNHGMSGRVMSSPI